MLLLCLSGCSPDAAPQPDRTDQDLPRTGRFGSLRDLVLFERADSAGGPFFLDRFEATRADWQGYLEAQPGQHPPMQGNAALPATNVDLWQARAFAAWRFCRLPHSDEWEYAAQRTNQWPWGDTADPGRANTAELGLGELTLVGTFESGRRGDGPYDLIGNAAEWTDYDWQKMEPSLLPDLGLLRWRLLHSRALTEWLPPGGVVPWSWLVAAVDDRIARRVVGGDCFSTMRVQDLVSWHLPGNSSSVLGMRLGADPRGLCTALAAFATVPSQLERAVLLRFLRRERNALVLAEAWHRVRSGLPQRGPLAAILDAELK